MLSVVGCATEQKTLGDLSEVEINIETDAPILGARDKAMDNYWEFMAGSQGQSQTVEALRRLADLELERSEERFQKQMEVFGQGQGEVNTDVDTLRSITYRSAIKLYEDALKAAVGGPLEAAILYQVSKAYEQAAQQEKAILTLEKLLALEPLAANRDELQFRRGELLFDLRRFTKAEQAYRQAMLANPNSAYFEKALTKHGWAYFKQEKFGLALESFFRLVDRKLQPVPGKPKKVLSRGDSELLNDVFRVAMLGFDELGGASAIKDYFSRVGRRDYETRVYRQLGEYYIEKGRIRDAADTFAAFARNFPMHEQAFEFDLKAIDTFTAAGFSSVLMKLKRDFVKRYRVKGPYWTHYQEQEDTVLARLKKALQHNSEDVVRAAHARAQKTKSAQDYQKTFFLYRRHLRWFGQSDTAQKLNFLFAELLFEAGQFESAAKEYEKTAYRYVRFGKNVEAGYAALLAYAEQEKRAEGKQKTIWSRLAVGSAMRFGKTFPNDKRAANVLTKAAQDMFALKKYSQAAVAARQILELSVDPSADTRRIAWKIIARAEFERGDYTRAEVAYKVALSLLGPNDSSRKSLEEGLAAAVYKQGEYMRSKGNIKAAIMQFARVAQVSPDSSVIISAEFDIAASMLEAKNWNGAIQEFLIFRQTNPNHPLTARIPGLLIKAYLASSQWVKAAEELRVMEQVLREPEQKRAAIWQAAELYEKVDDTPKLIELYQRYVRQFPAPLEQAMEARQKLVVLYAAAGRKQDREHWLKEIVHHSKGNAGQSTPRIRYLAAKAAYELAKPELALFQAIKLVKPLRQNLKRKKQKMKAAVDAYMVAANFGIADVATASVYWVAEIYNEFGQALMSSERPPGLSEEELEQYDILLEEQAYPFEEKSINIHETNVERIVEGTYDKWIKKSLGKLMELSPVRYAKTEKGELFAQQIY
ncbi:MAG: tetratricopeptide repeat protein [Gammaproteobacteria bacterium]|nr:tetratricopeptide repeat protein [Gammaproteobacteria bacterium]